MPLHFISCVIVAFPLPWLIPPFWFGPNLDQIPSPAERAVIERTTTVELPRLTYSELKTTVHLPDGGTVLIGGMTFRPKVAAAPSADPIKHVLAKIEIEEEEEYLCPTCGAARKHSRKKIATGH